MTNAELEASDDEPKSIFTVKGVERFHRGNVECFVDELTKITNSEVVYSDKLVRVFFATDGIDDPNLFNEQALEEAQLGTFASYRNKSMVSRTIL